MASVWTEAKVAEMLELIAQSKSLDQIAHKLGMTRGQVGGKRHRLGLSTPGRGGKRFVTYEPKAKKRPRRGLLTPPSMPVVNETYSDHNRTLIQLTTGKCHWPLWDQYVAFEGRLYCGAKCMGEHSYCEEHYTRSRRVK
jgi:hypothetical protein